MKYLMLFGPLNNLCQKAREAAEAERKGREMAAHWSNYFEDIGVIDLFGRSVQQAIFIGVLTWGLSWILLSNWKKADKLIPVELVVSLLIAVTTGFFYEGLRSHPSTAPFAGLLLLLACFVPVAGLVVQREFIANMWVAARQGRLLSYFRRGR